MEKLIEIIRNNLDIIKEEVLRSHKSTRIDAIINDVLLENNA